jgi:hypothetical protein
MNLGKLYNKYSSYFIIASVTLVSTLVLWMPFILKQSSWIGLNIKDLDFHYIYKQFDGAFYIIPAKTLYEVKKIDIPGIGFILSLPLFPGYFAAHLPLYPLFIRLGAVFLGYLKSMIFVNVFFTVILSIFFYYFISKLKLSMKPLLLVIVFLFLPRFLVVRSVGAPESLFILLILASLFFFEKNNYLLAGFLGGLSAATKTPGVLLFIVYILAISERFYKEKKFNWQWLYLFLIPTGLLAVFLLYLKQYGDFFAYFHTNAVVPMPYLFSAFNWQTKWVGTAWLEEIVMYFFIYALTVITLWKSKYRSFFYFSLVFFIATTFVQHRDISRYSLPLWPFACLAFEKFFTSKNFLLALLIILPAIYLYAWNFLSYNVMPISDWSPFL